jgi:hypothetical protein
MRTQHQQPQICGEPLELYQTCEHTMNVQQQVALFERLNAEHAVHFNRTEVNFEQPPYHIPRQRRPKSRADHAQNLRTIAMHIRCIIVNNPNLTIKVLSYILFEIMGNT